MSKLEFFTTEDGSPTAYFENFEGEKMHHSGGAFGESVYIYGPAIQWGFAKTESPIILSLGTGLAYNEIISAAFSVVFDAPLKMASYESNEDLNKGLNNWLVESNEGIVPFQIYNEILEMTAKTFDIPALDIKNKLRASIANGDWKILGAWDDSIKDKFHVIIYDFFSTKAMEAFWSEEFLTAFLKTNTLPQCSFATYACTGNLKRALKGNNFTFFERKGYLWKRSSTFAKRG